MFVGGTIAVSSRRALIDKTRSFWRVVVTDEAAGELVEETGSARLNGSHRIELVTIQRPHVIGHLFFLDVVDQRPLELVVATDCRVVLNNRQCQINIKIIY